MVRCCVCLQYITLGYNSGTKQAYFQIGKTAAVTVPWTPSNEKKVWVALSMRKTGWSFSFSGTKTLVKASAIPAGADRSVPEVCLTVRLAIHLILYVCVVAQPSAAIDRESDASAWDPDQSFSHSLYTSSNSGSTITKADNDSYIYVVRCVAP